jgi:hypothetical protein
MMQALTYIIYNFLLIQDRLTVAFGACVHNTGRTSARPVGWGRCLTLFDWQVRLLPCVQPAGHIDDVIEAVCL